MRGNCGHLRWLPSTIPATRLASLIIILMMILPMLTTVHSGTIIQRHKRMIREVYKNHEAKPQNETKASSGTCIMDGVQVPENSVQCEKNPGCRAIQKTGYCCPDYQCECERNGTIYGSGDKLFDPETPCKVCYCQGGEILCNFVTCYIRNDCGPKYINGRCCPEYDNCPPLENVKLSTPQKQSTTHTTLTLDEFSEEKASMPSVSSIEMLNSNPLGIKITEITKAEEIRIVDGKPKQTYQITKAFNNTGNEQLNEQKESHLFDLATDEVMSSIKIESVNSSKIISESINRLESADINLIRDEDAQKKIRETSITKTEESSKNDLKITNSSDTTESNQKTENKTESIKPTSEVGEKLVFLDSNGNQQPITVFGTKGLLRGDLFESSDYEERKNAAKRENPTTISPSTEIIYANSETNGSQSYDSKSITDLEPVGSSSDDFIRILLSSTKRSFETSTVSFDTSKSLTVSEGVFETIFYTSTPDSFEENSNSTELIFDTVYKDSNSSENTNMSTESPFSTQNSSTKVADQNAVVHHNPIEDDDTILSESNPAYPTIPEEDLSNYGREVLISSFSEVDDEFETVSKPKKLNQRDDGKILGEILDMKTNISIYNNISTIKPTSWLKEQSEGKVEESSIIQERSPGEPLLIPEWERNLTSSNETKINGSSVVLDVIDFKNLESFEIDAESGSGSGSGRYREPTTSKIKKIIDIDEIEASSDITDSAIPQDSFQHNPKDDAESVKYNDENDETNLKMNIERSYTPNSGLKRALEAIHSFQKSYLNKFFEK